MSYRVVIPSRNIENARACIESLSMCAESEAGTIIDDSDAGMVGFSKILPGIKPFVFARNVNLGIKAAGNRDVIILNDDTRLMTNFGFAWLATTARDNPNYGVISAGITGAVGNPEQIAQAGTRLREAKHHTLVFVCVYIRRAVLDQVGLLDERYTGYGYDDDDYCERVRMYGYKLGVFDGCVVEHGVLPSSYRGGPTDQADLEPNRERFREKWGFLPGKNPKKNGRPTAPPKVVF